MNESPKEVEPTRGNQRAVLAAVASARERLNATRRALKGAV